MLTLTKHQKYFYMVISQLFKGMVPFLFPRAPWRRGRASVCEIHIDSSDSVLEWGQLTCIALIHGQNVDSAL